MKASSLVYYHARTDYFRDVVFHRQLTHKMNIEIASLRLPWSTTHLLQAFQELFSVCLQGFSRMKRLIELTQTTTTSRGVTRANTVRF